MTYNPVIYDWRQLCAPINQVFASGGSAGRGRLTLGGVSVSNPEPGGNATLKMDFNPFATEAANIDASWTISRIQSGAIMRVPLFCSVQLVSSAGLGAGVGDLPWSNDELWSNDQGWASTPSAPVAAPAQRGSQTCTVDLSDYGQILKIGHVIGFNSGKYSFAHIVMDIDYTGGDAEISISPPLRRALTTDSYLTFRPKMMVQCRNAEEVAGTFRAGRHVQLNSAEFIEALL